MASPKKPSSKVTEWQHLLLILTSLLFETLSGLSIYLLPFSISSQVMVLLHTGVGLLFLVPYLWYQLRHWRRYQSRPMTHVKLTGYVSMGATALAIISGVVLSWQALREENTLASLAVYGLFGVVLVKSEVVSWFRIQEMFRFDSVHMYGIMGSAVVVAAVGVQLISGTRTDLRASSLVHAVAQIT